MDAAQKRRERLEKWKAANSKKAESPLEPVEAEKPAEAPVIKPVIEPVPEPVKEEPKKKTIISSWSFSGTQFPATGGGKRVNSGKRTRTTQANDSQPRKLLKSRLLGEYTETPAESLTQSSQEDLDDPLDAFMNQLDADTVEEYNDVDFNSVDEGPIEGTPSDDGIVDPEALLADIEKKQTKVIPTVDHSKMEYAPFRKQFYHEPSEIADTEEDKQLQWQARGIVVKNTKLAPLENWGQAGFSRPVMETLAVKGYNELTPIQAQALPVLMSGQDMLGIAQTGSGKTMAFVLPLLRHVQDQHHGPGDGPIALVLTPTRELCVQIANEMTPFLESLQLTVLTAYGGSDIKPQIAQLKRGTHIVVCTPGRMIDLLAANGGRVANLQRTTFLVIDEADRMFDMGFEPQIHRIIRNIRPDSQNALFSATLSSVMERLARQVLKNPVQVIVGKRSTVSSTITQFTEVLSLEQKFLRLLEILGKFYQDQPTAQAIIFVDKQEGADQLATQLLRKRYKGTSLHGGKDQDDRDSAMNEFKQGKIPLLVATSLAARGLDVKNIRLVVNYDPPSHLEDYVHRVGRTGRAGTTGTAYTFLSPDDARAAYDISKALKMAKLEVPTAVKELASQFKRDGAGKKINHGFGGQGLSRLDDERRAQRVMEQKHYDQTNEGPDTSRAATEEPSQVQIITAPPPEIVSGDATAQGSAKGISKAADANYFTTKLEINDYPQQARVAVTAFSQQSKIIEAFGVSITNRGQYYGPGAKADGEKLHLLIEGDTEAAVSGAYNGLIEALNNALTQASKVKGGRYNV